MSEHPRDELVRSLVERLAELDVIDTPSDEYSIEWPSRFDLTASEREWFGRSYDDE